MKNNTLYPILIFAAGLAVGVIITMMFGALNPKADITPYPMNTGPVPEASETPSETPTSATEVPTATESSSTTLGQSQQDRECAAKEARKIEINNRITVIEKQLIPIAQSEYDKAVKENNKYGKKIWGDELARHRNDLKALAAEKAEIDRYLETYCKGRKKP